MEKANRRLSMMGSHLKPLSGSSSEISLNKCGSGKKGLLEGEVAIITGSGQGLVSKKSHLAETLNYNSFLCKESEQKQRDCLPERDAV